MNKLHDNLNQIIKTAIAEDISIGDITTQATINPTHQSRFWIKAKEDCILCGIEVIELVLQHFDSKIEVETTRKDGDHIKKDQIFFQAIGNTSTILSAERIILNLMQYMSGISSKTYEFVRILDNNKIQILDTRKTLPMYREIVKYSVGIGGGHNHRMGLYDMFLIKDNHIKSAGNIKNALSNTHKYIHDKGLSGTKIEIECETIEDIYEVLNSPPTNIIMLDNMKVEDMQEAIKIIRTNNSAIKIEVSGNITIENISQLSLLDIDYISIGSLTHSVKSIDLSLNLSLECLN